MGRGRRFGRMSFFPILAVVIYFFVYLIHLGPCSDCKDEYHYSSPGAPVCSSVCFSGLVDSPYHSHLDSFAEISDRRVDLEANQLVLWRGGISPIVLQHLGIEMTGLSYSCSYEELGDPPKVSFVIFESIVMGDGAVERFTIAVELNCTDFIRQYVPIRWNDTTGIVTTRSEDPLSPVLSAVGHPVLGPGAYVFGLHPSVRLTAAGCNLTESVATLTSPTLGVSVPPTVTYSHFSMSLTDVMVDMSIEGVSVLTCFGFAANETHLVCSGHGVCDDYDVCSCVNTTDKAGVVGYSGVDCSVFSCFGIPWWEEETVCSSMGQCVGFDECECTHDAVPEGFLLMEDCSLEEIPENSSFWTGFIIGMSVLGSVLCLVVCFFAAVCGGVMGVCCRMPVQRRKKVWRQIVLLFGRFAMPSQSGGDQLELISSGNGGDDIEMNEEPQFGPNLNQDVLAMSYSELMPSTSTAEIAMGENDLKSIAAECDGQCGNLSQDLVWENTSMVMADQLMEN